MIVLNIAKQREMDYVYSCVYSCDITPISRFTYNGRVHLYGNIRIKL